MGNSKEAKETEILLNIQVRKDIAWKIRRKVFEILYSEGEGDGIVYNFIFNHPHLTIGQMRYQLEDIKVYRTAKGIKKIADWCKLPYHVVKK